jgi:hypothetical protein
MKQLYHTTLLFLLLSTAAIAQTFRNDYYFQAGSIYNDGIYDMAVDAQGNIYIVGYFGGSVDFDPGPGTFMLHTTPGVNTNAYVQKLDANYNLLWAKSFGGTSNTAHFAEDVAVDDSGNVYVSGIYQKDIRFEPNGTVWTSGSTDTNLYMPFLVKLDSAGAVVWGYGWSAGSAPSSATFNDVSLDDYGGVYIGGHFTGTMDFDPATNASTTRTSNGSGDVFLMKMAANGDFKQVRKFGGTGADYIRSVCILNDQLFLTGEYRGLVDVAFGPQIFYLNSLGHADCFVVKVDTALNFENAVSFGSTLWDEMSESVITNSGKLINYGRFKTSVDFNPGSGDSILTTSNNKVAAFVQALDTNLLFDWARKIETTDLLHPNDITEKSGQLLITGHFYDMVDLDPSPNTTFTVSQTKTPSGADAYVLVLDTAGNFMVGGSFGSYATNYFYATEFSAANKYLIGGIVDDTMDVDPTSGVNYLIGLGFFGDNLFMELGTCTLQPEDTAHIIACQSYMLPDSQVTTSSTYYSGVAIGSTGCDSNYVLDVVIKVPADFNLNATRVDTTLIASAQGTNLSYQWLDCGANLPIAGATDSVLAVSVNGSYAVIVSDSICTDTSTCITVNDISIAEDVLATGLLVYPNPTNGRVVVESLLHINHIYVLDMAGRMVLSAPDPGKEVNVGALQPGVYILKAATTGGVAVERLVKR